jgi:hypothetical protein
VKIRAASGAVCGGWNLKRNKNPPRALWIRRPVSLR